MDNRVVSSAQARLMKEHFDFPEEIYGEMTLEELKSLPTVKDNWKDISYAFPEWKDYKREIKNPQLGTSIIEGLGWLFNKLNPEKAEEMDNRINRTLDEMREGSSTLNQDIRKFLNS